MNRPARTLRDRARSISLVVALGLFATPALAQEAPPAEGASEEGNPVPGYIATGVLAGAAMFVLCKSARR